jgi:TPR repeat protein
MMHPNGDFVEANKQKTFSLTMKAASKGYFIALSNLGYYYQHGIGVEQNYSESFIIT